MQRDMDLIRQILLKLEQNEHGTAPEHFQISGYADEVVAYHCYLLDQAGLIKAAISTSENHPSPFGIPIRMTWQGHEFLDNARNEIIWQQAKMAINKIGEASFSIWSKILEQAILNTLNL